MSYVTVEVVIEHGRVVAREPDKLPEHATGLLTILPSDLDKVPVQEPGLERVQLPLIRGDGKNLINPTPEELDASAWGS